MGSSPNPYHSCQRYGSAGASSNNNGSDWRGKQRHRYEDEIYFVWYHHEKKCPALREQHRMRVEATNPELATPRFGAIEWARVWYP
ncbi:uncharacterized protein N7482_006541 [Penicillium canariense]|uniref:Uncharacterized protein n=1 Tax=Penicillium canariense TaxID=189055 RepID=A0A9W9HY06_9EURO|nr:uncharacterized protein N7482_006541 [Penicillium canariense]KAJ5159537.1 hypothetical protein N7482_006541 [Penicillium canariense]